MVIVKVIKIAAVAGTIYVVHEMGVWREPEVTEVVFEEWKKDVKPYTDSLKRALGMETKPQTWDEKVEQEYNRALRSFTKAMSQVPHYLRNFASDVSDIFTKLFDSAADALNSDKKK